VPSELKDIYETSSISTEKRDRCAWTFKSGRWKSRVVQPRVLARSRAHSFAKNAN